MSARRPDAIDNSALLDPAFPADLAILRKDIMEGDDYALVEEQAALLLESWYPGPGPVLARKVITAGIRKRTRVDLHPLRFRLLACDPNTGLLPADEAAAAAAAGGIVKTLSGKAVLTDLQEELHTAATQAEGKSRRASNADMTEEVSELRAQIHLSLIQSDGLEAEFHQVIDPFFLRYSRPRSAAPARARFLVCPV